MAALPTASRRNTAGRSCSARGGVTLQGLGGLMFASEIPACPFPSGRAWGSVGSAKGLPITSLVLSAGQAEMRAAELRRGIAARGVSCCGVEADG